MSLSVGQVVGLVHQIAPPELAESWDNVGLQVGAMDWKVNKILVALDPHLSVVADACNQGVDLLITHHPLFLKPILQINSDTGNGQIVSLALKNQLAIFCAHTNFDSAPGGVNDILADKIGLIKTKVLKKNSTSDLCKLVVFAPINSEQALLKALFRNGAGKIGNYSCCSFRNKGLGSFLPGKQSNPYIGTQESLSEINEIRIESIINKENLDSVIDAIKKVHPYETVPYDIYPILTDDKVGIGRIGKLKNSMPLNDFINQIKLALNLTILKVSGNLSTPIEYAAVCSGSGTQLMQNFFESRAQVYISADISYHSAIDAQNMGLAVVDLGHFHSEKIAIGNLVKLLKTKINKIDKNVSISETNVESDVFEFI